MLVLVLAAVIIALCGSLVSCQEQAQPVTLVMDTQYYDTNNNFIEIPMLAATNAAPRCQSVNHALSTLKERYTSVLSSPSDQPGGIIFSCSPL